MSALFAEDIQHLDEKGYVVKENFFNNVKIHKFKQQADHILSFLEQRLQHPDLKNFQHYSIHKHTPNGPVCESNTVNLTHNSIGKISYLDPMKVPATYRTFCRFSVNQNQINKHKCILVEKRGARGFDNGMYDITYPVYHDGDVVTHAFTDMTNIDNSISEILLKLSNYYKSQYYLESLKIYVNDSIQNTRDFHRDTTKNSQNNGKIKAFIFLTDIKDIHDGPYSYIEGTHKDYELKEHDGQKKTFLGNAGTLVISNQNGLHRGMPQSTGRSRTMLVLHLFKKKKI